MSRTRSRHAHRAVQASWQPPNQSIGTWDEPVWEGDHWRVIHHGHVETRAFLERLMRAARESEGTAPTEQ